MAQETVGIKIQVDANQASQSIGSLKTQLREAQKEVTELSAKFGATSQEAVQAAKKAADLKDQIGDAKALTDAFNPDAKFKAFTATLAGVAGGFAAVQGALGLVGVESDKVEKTLLKVQSAMAISQGLQTIGESIDSFKQLGAVIRNVNVFQKAYNLATIAAAGIQKAFGVAVGTTGVAFKALRAAIITTGIGALVVGIGLLVNKIMDWVDSASEAEKAQEKLAASTKKLNGDIDNQISILTALGNKEDEIYKLKVQRTDNELNVLRNKLKTQGKLSEEELADFRKLKADKEVLDIQEANRIKKKQEEELKNQKGTNDKAKEIRDANQKEILSAQQALEDIRIENEQNEFLRNEKRINLDFVRRKAEIENLKVSEQLKTALLVEEEKKREVALQENRKLLQKVSDEAKKEAELKDVNAKAQQLNNEQLFQRGITAITQTRVQIDEQLEENLQEARKRRASETIGLLENLTAVVGRDTLAGKALGVATALINTYQGASEAVKQKSTLPSPFDVIAKVANVGAIIATGLKTVKAITSVRVPNVGGGGGGQTAPSFSTAPIAPTPTPQVQSTLLNTEAIQQLGNATNRAYVIESDVTNSQERIRRINRAARLG